MSDKNLTYFAKISTQAIACEDPRAVPAILPFSSADEWNVSLQYMQEQNVLKGVQGFYFDAADITDRCVVTVEGTGQRVIITEQTQGYMPLLIPETPKITFSNDGQGNIGTLRVIFVNVPLPAAVWNAAP